MVCHDSGNGGGVCGDGEMVAMVAGGGRMNGYG